jgi:hypothetical protein
MSRPGRSGARLAALALATVGVLAIGQPAVAAPDESQARAYVDTAFPADVTQSPTRAESQSKLWFHAESWWALLMEPTGRTTRVFQLMPDHTWRPTSTVVNSDTGIGSVADVAQDGDTVHVVTRSSDGSLYYVRLSFDAAGGEYRADPGRLVTTRNSVAPAMIAKDSAGTLWVAYANAVNVVVIPSTDGGLTWGRVLTLTNALNRQTPESASLVAFDGRMGILWSDQAAGAFVFASHRNGDPPGLWAREQIQVGAGLADNHVSLVRLRVPGQAADTLVAAVKTSTDETGGTGDSPLLVALVRTPGGEWSRSTLGTIADGLNNPVLVVDDSTQTLHMIAARGGNIVTKTAPFDNLTFPAGVGSVLISGGMTGLVDPTVTKDHLNVHSGLVTLASDMIGRHYRHAELPLTPSTPFVDPNDHTAPTTPADLHGHAVSPERVVLSWSEANDGDRWAPAREGVSVAGYVLFRNGVEVGKVTATSAQDQVSAGGADEARTVTYQVKAVDTSGNLSAAAEVVVRVPAPPSGPPLPVVIGLLVGAALVGAYALYRRRMLHKVAARDLTAESPDVDGTHPTRELTSTWKGR